MRTSLFLSTLALCISTLISGSEQSTTLPLVQSDQLRETLLDSELLAKAQVLEDLAYATVERNRVVGSPGHVGTIKYLVDTVSALDYYDVTTQNFTVPLGNSSLNINDTFYESNLMTFSAAGHPIAPLVAVANLGCNSSDYSADVSGSIALILRGTCAFGLKSALAGAAGAAGAIIYNNVEGALLGTLGLASRPEGPYPPTIGISQADGQALLSSLASGPISADLETVLTNVTTYNVIAQTKGGDPENVLHVGAHSDSVTAGPGINDNGSGSIGLLEVAIQLSNFSVNNAVRFSWWSAEEEGLIGATRYVESLSEDELDNIRLYLNFDMIASPNFIYGIYDGDGSAFNVSGPSGSAEAEKLFQDYFTNDADLPWTSVDFDGRSDYGPFLDAGIASGGLFTGAEVLKTQEEASFFGGEAGVAYDVNYHASGDNVANLNIDAFVQNTKAIAHAVATYGISFESLSTIAENKEKRTNALQVPRQIGDAHTHFHGHGCLADL